MSIFYPKTKVVDNCKDEKFASIERRLLKQPLLKMIEEKPARIKTSEETLIWMLSKHVYPVEKPITQFVESHEADLIGVHGRRSSGDLFLLLRYYFPEITYKEVRNLLIDLVNEKLLGTDYCSTIHKRVFWGLHKGDHVNIVSYGSEVPDEYGDYITYSND